VKYLFLGSPFSISLSYWLSIETKKKKIQKGGTRKRCIYDCRWDERLKPKDEESTCLEYTGLLEELEYLKIKTRLIDEKFANVMGECVI
jgi:hypothetical protein